MKIEIPDDLVEEFLNFLDVSQSFFTEDQIFNFCDNEKKVIELVEKILEDNNHNPSLRWENKEEREIASNSIKNILCQ